MSHKEELKADISILLAVHFFEQRTDRGTNKDFIVNLALFIKDGYDLLNQVKSLINKDTYIFRPNVLRIHYFESLLQIQCLEDFKKFIGN